MQLGNTQIWISPPAGFAKINVQGGLSQTGMNGVAVAFYRDNQGLYLGVSALVLTGVIDTATLEALTCREGLALTNDLYVQRLVLASDYQSVIKNIAEGTGGRYQVVIKDIPLRNLVSSLVILLMNLEARIMKPKSS